MLAPREGVASVLESTRKVGPGDLCRTVYQCECVCLHEQATAPGGTDSPWLSGECSSRSVAAVMNLSMAEARLFVAELEGLLDACGADEQASA